jgi:hypothetical protein
MLAETEAGMDGQTEYSTDRRVVAVEIGALSYHQVATQFGTV